MRGWSRAPWLLSLALAACGGADPAPAHEAPAPASGGEAPSATAPAEEAAAPGSCADVDGGAYYLYLGADAMVAVRPDGSRERHETDGLEDRLRALVRDDLRARHPGAAVHVVTDVYAAGDDAELALRVLADEGATADRCAPGPDAPFPSAADALFAE